MQWFKTCSLSPFYLLLICFQSKYNITPTINVNYLAMPSRHSVYIGCLIKSTVDFVFFFTFVSKAQIFRRKYLPNSEKAMATHSSTLAWKIPWTEEPGRLQSMGVTKSRTRQSSFTFTHWRRKWQHSSVLAWRIPVTGSLVGCHLWGHTESDTTEATQQQQHLPN